MSSTAGSGEVVSVSGGLPGGAFSPEAFLRELVASGALDELSNADDGSAVERYVRSEGLLDPDAGTTRRALTFLVYQTGMQGPQNGYRLCLVREGVRPEDARAALQAPVAQDASDFVVM
jgi:hypothetical protein